MTKALSIEFGAFDGGYSQDPSAIPVINATQDLQGMITREFGDAVDLTLIPYDGTKGLWGGGRRNSPSTRDLIQAIGNFNAAGMPFMLAMNGGLGLPPETGVDLADHVFSTEREVLDALQKNSERYKVRNLVTILHRKLLEVINRQYPNLGVINSCIGFTGGKREQFKGRQEYDEAFEKFEGVVPLNQHTTPEFLREWIRYASKMVLLLNSHCDCPDMHKCFKHYQLLDAPYLFHALRVNDPQKGEVPDEDFESIHNPEFPYTPGCDDSNRGQLLLRQDHLKEFMQWGVKNFKMGRNPLVDPLNPPVIREFVRTFLEAA